VICLEIKTKILKINPQAPEPELIEQAAQLLREDGIVTIPTETVYGLAGNALNKQAAEKIYKAKGRPSDNPLIVHIADKEDVFKYAKDVPEKALKLFEAFSPGPLTVVLKKKDIIPDSVSGKLDTVALRIPNNNITLSLIRACGFPLAAPSANISGSPSPTDFEHTYKDLYGKVNGLIDGGKCDVGVESTIISLAGDKAELLRPGGITVEQLESVVGSVEIDECILNKMHEDFTPKAPGMKYKHYAPKARVTIVKGNNFTEYINQNSTEKTGVLCFDGEKKLFKAKNVLEYGNAGDSNTQAQNLFRCLRAFDEMEVDEIFARCPQPKGVGLAVYNRLIKAAAYNVVDADSKKMFIIGITGGSGCGKSTVGEIFKSKGFCYIDTDKTAKEITQIGQPALAEIKACFGDVFFENGELDRKALAKIVFSDNERLKQLNKITHKYITEKVINTLEECKNSGVKGAVIDGAALIESKINELCDCCIFVTASVESRLKRIVERDGLTLQEAQRRIGGQKSDDFYKNACDFTIVNDSGTEGLVESVDKILKELKL